MAAYSTSNYNELRVILLLYVLILTYYNSNYYIYYTNSTLIY